MTTDHITREEIRRKLYAALFAECDKSQCEVCEDRQPSSPLAVIVATLLLMVLAILIVDSLFDMGLVDSMFAKLTGGM